MINTAPTPVDVSDFQFKLKCRVNVFKNESSEEFSNICNLVACASRYGLIFVGTNSNHFKVIQAKDIENLEKGDKNCPSRIVELPSRAKHFSVNCDSTKLSVVLEKNGCATAIFYDVKSFFTQNINIIKEIRLCATPGVKVLQTDWNPAIPDIFTACKTDGSLGVYEFKGQTISIKEIPGVAGNICFCWSPKGKQIAVGSKDGKITQYKPDLKAVKSVNPPPFNGSQSIIALRWISSFQFVGIYKDNNPNTPSSVIVIDAPKTGNPVYTNYEDICYSYGTTRPTQFYMLLQQQWNILMVASSNSMEVGVMGLNKEKWIQLILGDSFRAELPLGPSKQDTLPLGATINTGTSNDIPQLFLLSHMGVLCCFNVHNTRPGCNSICSPPEKVTSDSSLFTISQPKIESKESKNLVLPEVTTKPPPPPPPSFLKPEETVEIKEKLTQPKPIQFPIVTTTVALVLPNQTSTNFAVANSNLSGPIATSTQKVQPLMVQQMDTLNSQNVIQHPPLPQSEDKNVLKDKQIKQASDGRIKKNDETEEMIAQLVRDECLHLEAELKSLLHYCKGIKMDVGDDKEAVDMTEKALQLEEFLQALEETSSVQASEVHTLKQNLIQTWAWYEEARSRFVSHQDPNLLSLLRAQPLDPASKRQLEELNHLIYYIDSQLIQANKSIDEQWDNFQDSLSKNTKVRIPTMKAIYQSMLKQNSTIRKQQYVLKDIAYQMKSCKRNYNTSDAILLTLDKADILEEELEKLKLCPANVPHHQHKKTLDLQKKFNSEKSSKLKQYLENSNVLHISITKPQLNDSTVHLTSLLAAPLSPIAPKKLQPTKLEFGISTPKFPQKQNEILFKLNSQTLGQQVEQPFNQQHELISQPTSATYSFQSGSLSKVPTTTKDGANLKILHPNITTNSAFGGLNANKPTATLFAEQTAKQTSSVSFSLSSMNVNTTSNSNIFSTFANSVQANEKCSTPAFGNSKVNATFLNPAGISFSSPALSTGFVAVNKSPSLITIPVVNKPSTFKISDNTTASVSKADTDISEISSPFQLSNTEATKPSLTFITPTTTKATSSTTLSAFTSKNASGLSSTIKPNIASTIFVATTAGPTFNSAAKTVSSINSPNLNMQTLFQASIPSNTSTPEKRVLSVVTLTHSSTDDSSVSSSTLTTTSSGLFSSQPMVSSTPVSFTSAQISSVSQMVPAKSIFSAPSGVSISPATTGTFGSLFSSTATTSSQVSSIFGTSGTATAKQSVFGLPSFTTVATPSQSLFSTGCTASSQTSTTDGVTTQASIFGGFAGSTTKSLFGGISTPATTTIQSSLFDATATTAAGSTTLFTSTTDTNTFGKSTIAASVFSGSSSSKSVFGTVATTAPPVFPTTTTVSPIFATTTVSPAFATTTSPVFVTTTVSPGFATIASPSFVTTASPVFATTVSPAFATTASPVFGTTTVSPAFVTTASPVFATSASSVFAATTTTPSTVFATTTTTPSSFAKTAATTSFGTTFSNTTTAPFGNTFGTSSTSGGSIFGQQEQTVFGGGSIFSSNTTKTTPGSIFGGSSFASVPTTNNFGSSAANNTFNTSQASPFGATSPFGVTTSTNSTPFSTPSTAAPFGQQTYNFANTPNSSFSSFGPSTNTPAFGFNSLNMGTTSTTTTSSFGSSTFQTSQNPFGRTVGESQKSTFGTGSIFGTPTTSSSASIFGGSSPFNKSTPAFGSPATFGGSPAFGAQSSSFGQAPSFSGSFGTTGSFTGNGQNVQQSGFGSPSFRKPASGFGSPPVFGSSSPGFGSAPSFGGSPAFGSSATFGSPQKVFGTPVTESGFGNMAQNSTFGNLANQNTLGFGNLAQQAGSAQTSNFSSGGSSFSSWR